MVNNRRICYAGAYAALGILLILPHPSRAGALNFPDAAGTIVSRSSDCVVRLLQKPGSSAEIAEALFIVNTSPQKMFSIITDYGHYPEFMPHIVGAKKIKQTSAEEYVSEMRFQVALWCFQYRLMVTVKQEHDSFAMVWRYLSGDVKNTEGFWKIRPDSGVPGRSVVYYRVLTEADICAPKWIKDQFTSNSVIDVVKAVRKRAEQQ